MVRKKVPNVVVFVSVHDGRRFADFFQLLVSVDVKMKKAKKRAAKNKPAEQSQSHTSYFVLGSARLHSDYRRIHSRSFKLRRALPFPIDKAVRPHDDEVFLVDQKTSTLARSFTHNFASTHYDRHRSTPPQSPTIYHH